MWSHYFDNVDALVYVVDSSDLDRVEENCETLHGLLEDQQLKDATLLVFANKQDLPSAMSPPSLVEKLGLHKIRGRKW